RAKRDPQCASASPELASASLPGGPRAARCTRIQYRGDGGGARHFRGRGQDALAAGSSDVARSAGAGPGWKLDQPPVFPEREQTMDMSCEDVWRDISNYIDNDLDPHQRAALGAHAGQR